MIGKIEKKILEIIARDGGIISVVIDPVDYASPAKAIETGVAACQAGVDFIAVGGSTGAQGLLLDAVTKGIKEKVSCPVILFPGNIATLTPHADAVFFMSLMNSRNPYWISQAQMLGAPVVKKMGVEPLPVGYIVVEPGGTVAWVGDANVVPRSKPKIAAALALAAEYSGSRFVFTDAGSASSLGHVPLEVVATVAKVISVPYIVAGGVRTPEEAGKLISAGADWIQIGTVAEQAKDAKKTISEFVQAVKKAGTSKVKK